MRGVKMLRNKDKRNQREIRRPDLEPAANEKSADIERAGSGDLGEKQPANQKAAQDEKQIDARPAEPLGNERNWPPELPDPSARGIKHRMAKKNKQYGNPTQYIQLNQAAGFGKLSFLKKRRAVGVEQ